MKAFTLAALFLASASSAIAGQLKINNWGNAPVYYWVNNDPHSRTVIPAHAIGSHNYVGGGASMSLKFTRVDDMSQAYTNNVMQFEYTLNDQLWYDISLINGSPFASGNVKVSPTGTGANAVRCLQLKCPANTICHDAYLAPKDDWATHNCPANVGDVWLDIDQPSVGFNRREEAKSF